MIDMNFKTIFTAIFCIPIVKGQCPTTEVNDAITRCDGSVRNGTMIYIDFHEINSPCTCTLVPAFSGSIFIVKKGPILQTCATAIQVKEYLFSCTSRHGLSPLEVIRGEAVTINAYYKQNFNAGTFYECLGFQGDASDIIVGSATGGGLIIIVVIIFLLVICIRTRNRAKAHQQNHTTEHSNGAFQYDHSLPDNPLYHSSQPVGDLGYPTVEKQQVDLTPSKMTAIDQKSSDYATSVKVNETKDHTEVCEIPMYATPKRPQSTSTKVTGVAIYAQVNKPRKITTHNPVRTQNQDGLVYLEVEQKNFRSTQNYPYTDEKNTADITYAEVKSK